MNNKLIENNGTCKTFSMMISSAKEIFPSLVMVKNILSAILIF